MKLKSKLVLAASSLLVLSGVAAGTGAYAWYSANRQVGLQTNNITASAEVTALSAEVITHDPASDPADSLKGTLTSSGNTLSSNDANTPLSFAFTQKLTDVSGIGNGAFYKPMFGTGSYQDNVTNGVDSIDPKAASNVIGSWDESTYESMYPYTIWYLSFQIKFKATGTEKVSLYLDGHSTVTDTTDSALPVAAAARFSAYNGTTELLYANPNGTGGEYVTGVSNNAYTNGIASTKIVDDTISTGFFTVKKIYGGANLSLRSSPSTGLVSYNSYTVGYLGDLSPADHSGSDSLTITFNVWIEGSDDDCVLDGTNFAGAFNTALKFYTISQSTMEQPTV